MSTSDFLAFVEKDNRLNLIKKASTPFMLRIPLYYTDHTVDGHSSRIITSYLAPLLDLISQKALEGDHLNEHEMFILAASAYLHDIGMIFYPREENVYASEIIRERHHELSYEIIMKSANQEKINNETLDLGLHIMGTKEYADWIALVAKGHRKVDLQAPEYDQRERGGKPIRLRELAALLRLADGLDIDYRRVPNIQELRKSWVPSESRIHWYPCHYVESVNPQRGYIALSFAFPQVRTEYVNPIVYLVKQKIRDCVTEVQNVLWPLIVVGVNENPKSIDYLGHKKVMEEDDFIRLSGEYLRRRSLGNFGTLRCTVGETKEEDLSEIAAISWAVWPNAPENESWYRRLKSEYGKYPEGFKVAKTTTGEVLGYTICFPIKRKYMRRALSKELSVADMDGNAIERSKEGGDFWIEAIVLSPEADSFVAYSLITAIRGFLRSRASLRRIATISMSDKGDKMADIFGMGEPKWTDTIGNECYKLYILEGEQLARQLKSSI